MPNKIIVAQLEDGTELDLSETGDVRAAALSAIYEKGDVVYLPQRIFETLDGKTISHEVVGVCSCGTVLFSTDHHVTEGTNIMGCGACIQDGDEVWESFTDEA